MCWFELEACRCESVRVLEHHFSNPKFCTGNEILACQIVPKKIGTEELFVRHTEAAQCNEKGQKLQKKIKINLTKKGFSTHHEPIYVPTINVC